MRTVFKGLAGSTFLFKSDIRDYYASFDQDILYQQLERLIDDRNMLRLLWGYLRRTVEEEVEFLKPWAEQAGEAGLSVLSPIRAALAQRIGRPLWPPGKNSRKRWRPCSERMS